MITESLNINSTAAEFNPAAYFKAVVDESGYPAFVFWEDLAQSVAYCDQQMSGLVLLPSLKHAESDSLKAKLVCH
ncbi:MAG TPA: hypothetical protein DCL66_15435 [Gammaproteobacteria bacterium]|nr:hypothetical protein [Gammaproteobacteria bacterium]